MLSECVLPTEKTRKKIEKGQEEYRRKFLEQYQLFSEDVELELTPKCSYKKCSIPILENYYLGHVSDSFFNHLITDGATDSQIDC
jgi:hypothetical protein